MYIYNKMKKIVKLKETDLIEIVQKILNEQNEKDSVPTPRIKFNPNAVNNISSYLNGYNLFLTAYIFKVNNIKPSFFNGDNFVIRYYNEIQNKSVNEIAQKLVSLFYNMDRLFIPQSEIEDKRNKVSGDGQPVLKKYNSEPFIGILNSVTPNKDFVTSVINKESNVLERYSRIYNNLGDSVSVEASNQYKERVVSYLNSSVPPNELPNYISSLNPSQKTTIPISRRVRIAVLGN
jgi:hypothetical protein